MAPCKTWCRRLFYHGRLSLGRFGRTGGEIESVESNSDNDEMFGARSAGKKARASSVIRGRQQVRITGGIWRSRRLTFPAMPGLRPTPDRVRETLFNWLGQDLTGWQVLDLFAGSGVLGFEAVSRGASWLGSVEQAARTAVQLRETANTLGIASNAWHLWQMDALGWLDQSERLLAGRSIDLVLLDPPFAQPELLTDVLTRLASSDWLSADAWVYGERSAQTELAPMTGWRAHRMGRAGESRFVLWQRAD